MNMRKKEMEQQMRDDNTADTKEKAEQSIR